MNMKILFTLCSLFLVGCAAQTSNNLMSELQQKQMLERFMAKSEVSSLRTGYLQLRDKEAPKFTKTRSEKEQFLAYAIVNGFREDGDESWIKYVEGKEYLAFMKALVARWQRREIAWAEIDYQIIAKGNDIERRFKEETAEEERRFQEARRRERRPRTVIINPPALPDYSQPPALPNYSQPPAFSGPNPHEAIMRCGGRAVDFVTGRCM